MANEEKALSALSDYVIFYEEPTLMAQMCAISAGENSEEAFRAAEMLFLADSRFSYPVRKAMIKKELKRCLEESERVNFEGFLRFRLSEYEKLLFRGISTAFAEALISREYESLFADLKEFVEERKSGSAEAHIYGYDVFDESGKKLTECDWELFSSEDFESEAERMVGILICASPKKVFVHASPDEETLDTVKRIFPFLIYS